MKNTKKDYWKKKKNTDKITLRKSSKYPNDIMKKTKKDYWKKKRNTEKITINVKKNAKYANANIRNHIVQNTEKQKCI